MNDLERIAKEFEGVEKAFQRGDAAALQKMLGTLLSTPEGRRLADDVGKIMKSR